MQPHVGIPIHHYPYKAGATKTHGIRGQEASVNPPNAIKQHAPVYGELAYHHSPGSYFMRARPTALCHRHPPDLVT